LQAVTDATDEENQKGSCSYSFTPLLVFIVTSKSSTMYRVQTEMSIK